MTQPESPFLKKATRPSGVRALVGLLLILWLTASGAACAGESEARTIVQVTAKGEVFQAVLVETPREQARGLGGRKALAPNEGMLFLYPTKSGLSFWMKDMLISIDMIWLDNTQVVHIESSVPFPAPGTPDKMLPVYSSPTPANGVLEIAAGRVAEIGLKVGDKVQITFGQQ